LEAVGGMTPPIFLAGVSARKEGANISATAAHGRRFRSADSPMMVGLLLFIVGRQGV